MNRILVRVCEQVKGVGEKIFDGDSKPSNAEVSGAEGRPLD
jgi:hypothetical protein